eukprot:1710745-Pyramimonas_sp.AAC.1
MALDFPHSDVLALRQPSSWNQIATPLHPLFSGTQQGTRPPRSSKQAPAQTRALLALPKYSFRSETPRHSPNSTSKAPVNC